MFCYRQYPPNFFGSIAPVKATPDMTKPVGVKDGLLFTAPADGLPEVTKTDNGAVATVLNGAWTPSAIYPEKIRTMEGDILSMKGNLEYQQGIIQEIYTGLQTMSVTLNGINREVL